MLSMMIVIKRTINSSAISRNLSPTVLKFRKPEEDKYCMFFGMKCSEMETKLISSGEANLKRANDERLYFKNRCALMEFRDIEKQLNIWLQDEFSWYLFGRIQDFDPMFKDESVKKKLKKKGFEATQVLLREKIRKNKKFHDYFFARVRGRNIELFFSFSDRVRQRVEEGNAAAHPWGPQESYSTESLLKAIKDIPDELMSQDCQQTLEFLDEVKQEQKFLPLPTICV